MAEAIGLAASISGLVTIGAQLGLVAIKLRGLREKFRTVPKVLERTIQEVALLELHIELLKRSMNGSRINQLIVFEHDAVIQMCLTSLHGIVKVLDDHERRLRKSEMYGKLMFLVSDSDMKELSDELERGKTNLVLATQLLAE